jgi:O-antigen/teichoic acid export membrane protein
LQDIRGQILRGSVWISGARVVVNALTALSTIVLARLLLPSDFGLVALATSMLVVLQAFTELSLSQALIHTKDPSRDHYNTAWTLSLMRGLLIGIGFAAAAPVTASLYAEPRLEAVMLALGLNAALSGIQNPKLIMLQKELKFHQDAIIGIVGALANVCVSIGTALVLHSYWALIAGLLAGQVASVAVSYTIFPFRPALRVKHFGELWRFSVWVSISQIVNTLNYRFDQLLVGTLLGRTELGLYTVGGRLAVVPGQELVRPLTSTLFPAFSIARTDPDRLRRAYQRVQGVVTAVALPTSVGFGLIADPFVRLALGPSWLDAIPIIQLLAFIYSLDTLGSLVFPLAMAKGETRSLFLRNCLKLAVRMPLILVGMVAGGLIGLLIGRAIAGFFGVLVDMTMVTRLSRLSIATQLRANTRCFLATGVMIIACLTFAQPATAGGTVGLALQLAGTIVLGLASYVLASWGCWQVAGRPEGPESEAIDIGRAMVRRLAGGWKRLRVQT